MKWTEITVFAAEDALDAVSGRLAMLGIDRVAIEQGREEIEALLRDTAKYWDFADMDALCDAFPRLKIVFAHPGDRARYLAYLNRMERHENVYLDLCGTGFFRYGMLRYGIKRVGATRFLFATDFPICNPAMQVYGLLYEIQEEKHRELIFSENVKRVYCLT